MGKTIAAGSNYNRVMPQYTPPIQNLMNLFARLPGIGVRSAERITFHILKQSTADALKLAEAITAVKTKIRHCSTCYNLTETDPCNVCSDASREQGLVCIVEQPKDLLAIEDAGQYKGIYHVLLGRISPLDGISDSDLTIDALLHRLAGGQIREVIMATNPTMDGDTTALHLQNVITARFPAVTITRLARGLPTGSSIEHANRNMLADAMTGRTRV